MTTKCVDELLKAYTELDSADAERLVKTLTALQEQHADSLSAYKRAAKKVVDEMSRKQAKILQNKVADLIVMQKTLKRIYSGKSEHAGEALLAIFEGSARSVKEGDVNIDGINNGNYKKVALYMETELENAGITKEALAGKFDKQVAREMGKLDVNGKYRSGTKSDVNPTVVKLAEIYSKINRMNIALEQAAGSTITPRAGYVLGQMHDSATILENSERWVDIMLQKLDFEKSFGAAVDEKAAREILEFEVKNYKEIPVDSPTSFTGGKREYHFKEGEFWGYHKIYGGHEATTLLYGIDRSIKKSARSAAIQEVFGSNPERMIEKLKKTMRKVSPKDTKLTPIFKKVDNAYDYATGVGERPGYSNWQKVFQGAQIAKGIEVVALLGKAGASALLDITTTMMSVKTASGQPMIKIALDQLVMSMKMLKLGTRKEVTELLSVAMDETHYMLNDLGIFSEAATMGGKTPLGNLYKRSMGMFMQLNGIRPITTWMRKTTGMMHVKVLNNLFKGGVLDTPWKRNTMKRLGVEPHEQAILQRLAKSGEDISPALIRNSTFKELGLPDDVAKHKLEQKLASYFYTVVNEGSPIGTAKQQRIMGRHLKQDDPRRIAHELFWQFRSAILKTGFVAEKMARAANDDGRFASKEGAKALSGAIMFATANYIATRYLSDIASGKKPRKFNKKLVFEGLVGSGLGGVVTDALFSGYGAQGAIGPVMGDVFDIVGGKFKPIKRYPAQNLWIKEAIINGLNRR